MELEGRARQSLGTSSDAVHRMVVNALDARGIRGDVVLDVGCGTGSLRESLGSRFDRYIGVDAVRFEGLPADVEFWHSNLDDGHVPLTDGVADVTTAVEIIEHLENPRQFVRELVRLTKPGGWVIVTTPNQLSFLSLLTLLVKQRFSAFQDTHYPAHLTALLEIDLRRIGMECGLEDIAMQYSLHGRVVLTGRHYPRVLAKLAPRACSDNMLLIGRKSLA
jgi:2-polyprenyl-3-methyl-5-hydroxy-6-metoxy-1,4-benzoquinol methylase